MLHIVAMAVGGSVVAALIAGNGKRRRAVLPGAFAGAAASVLAAGLPRPLWGLCLACLLPGAASWAATRFLTSRNPQVAAEVAATDRRFQEEYAAIDRRLREATTANARRLQADLESARRAHRIE